MNCVRTNVYRNIQQYPEASKVPGVVIVRVDSAIYFSNSNYIKERILRWLTAMEEQLQAAGLPNIQFLIIEMSPVTDIDTSGIHALEELLRSLQKRDVEHTLHQERRFKFWLRSEICFYNLISAFLKLSNSSRGQVPLIKSDHDF